MTKTLNPEMTRKHTLQLEYTKTVNFMITANVDLVKAETVEDYAQAALIQAGIDLHLINQSVLLSELTGKKEAEIFRILKNESNYLLRQLRDDSNAKNIPTNSTEV